MDVSFLSDQYQVKRLDHTDIVQILSLCRENSLFYRYCPPFPTEQSILNDMEALPTGKDAADKYYVGYYEKGTLIAVLDLILAYPDQKTAFIGFFMMKKKLQNKGIGSGIIAELCSFLSRAGFSAVRLGWVRGNKQAESFWHKNGFTERGETADNGNYTVITADRMLHTNLLNENGRTFVILREAPELMDLSAEWFHEKWGVPKEAYLACMQAYLDRKTEYGWYLCLDSGRIIGGLGVIENDFHDRKDLTPNVCAVYTEEAFRCQGIAGKLLDMVVTDMKDKGITPLYLVTDHTGFYERYGWEFFCMVQGDGEPEMTRMYIHR